MPQETQPDRSQNLDTIIGLEGADLWLDLIQRATRTDSPQAAWAAISRETEDGLHIPPLAQPGPHQTAATPLARENRAGRHPFIARIDMDDSAQIHNQIQGHNQLKGNTQIMTDLTSGADGLHLVLSTAHNRFGFGLDMARTDLPRLLEGVYLDAIMLEVSGPNTAFLEALHSLCDAKAVPVPQCKLTLRGRSQHLPLQTAKRLGFAPKWLVDGTIWHNAGATSVQELAFVLADCADALRAQHTPQQSWASETSLLLTANQDQFETLTKLRAARLLWARLLDALDWSQQPVHIGAETSYRMLSRRDPWTNVIRNAIAAASAHMGGCDSLRVLPHTQANGLPGAAARRLARNTALILRDESHLDFPQDAAADAPALEDLSLQMAEAAWALFQHVEQKGGLSRAGDWISSGLADARKQRAQALETGARSIIGQTLYKADIDPDKIHVLTPIPPDLPTLHIGDIDLSPVRETQALECQEEKAAP